MDSEVSPVTNKLNQVKESRHRLGDISQEMFYKLVRSRQLEVVKIGRRTYVSDVELDRFIEQGGTAGRRGAS